MFVGGVGVVSGWWDGCGVGLAGAAGWGFRREHFFFFRARGFGLGVLMSGGGVGGCWWWWLLLWWWGLGCGGWCDVGGERLVGGGGGGLRGCLGLVGSGRSRRRFWGGQVVFLFLFLFCFGTLWLSGAGGGLFGVWGLFGLWVVWGCSVGVCQ